MSVYNKLEKQELVELAEMQDELLAGIRGLLMNHNFKRSDHQQWLLTQIMRLANGMPYADDVQHFFLMRFYRKWGEAWDVGINPDTDEPDSYHLFVENAVRNCELEDARRELVPIKGAEAKA